MKRTPLRLLVFLTAMTLLLAPSRAVALDEPNAYTVTADLLVARPLGVAATVGGAALFVGTLPFVAFTELFSRGNVKKSAETLVAAPAKITFKRPLGAVD